MKPVDNKNVIDSSCSNRILNNDANRNSANSLHVIIPKFIKSEQNYLMQNGTATAAINSSKRHIHSSPAKASSLSSATSSSHQRRLSQDSALNKYSNVRHSDPYIRHSSDNIRVNATNSYINSDSSKPPPMSPLLNEEDDITESPLLQKTMDIWNEEHLSRQHVQQQLQNDPFSEKSEASFGPKVNSENIPGTPMEPDEFMLENNQNQTILINEIPERRKSIDMASTKPVTPVKDSANLSATNTTITSLQLLNHTTNTTTTTTKTSHQNCTNINSLNNNMNLNNKDINNKKRPSLTISEIDNKSDIRRSSKQDKEGLDPESLMFRDGRRKIDMVLCYEEENEGVMTEFEARRRENRKCFLENLVKEGLELEVEDKSQSFDEKTYFVKIHMPWRTESRYAEVLNLKLPVKRFITISVKAWDDDKNNVLKLNYWRRWLRKFQKMIDIDRTLIDTEATFFSATAGGNPEEQFIVKDRCTSYTSAQRSQIVMQILLRAKFDETEKCGIRRLLADGSFMANFPLHEGGYEQPHSTGAVFDRRKLYLEWARPNKWFKKQPLCLIRKYFGDKIALYFCWLGFYTNMLIYPAVVGTLCFFYGVASLDSDDNTPSAEICDRNRSGSIALCPLCDKACDYQELSDSCLFSRITYLFDNPSTVFFAIFMSFWATTFLELWKRKQSVIIWEWDLGNIDSDEENRPEFEATVKTYRTNPVTREKEPYMPTWSRAVRYVGTGSAVLFMICVVLAAVLGTIIYRISVVSVIYGGGNEFVKTHAKIFTTMTAATINLIIIMLLTRVYHNIAIRLTNFENPRTHTEYEDSYTFKIFFFEFMNFYSSLIYIAFFKGRFYEYPGDEIARQSEFYRLKGDICDPAGCLSELCIQLAIIMVGKQIWNNFMEYLFPVVYNWWRQRKHKKQTKDETHLHMSWEQDYHMQDPGRLALFDEYLEMVLQYGFVTLFVAAFPLAPLFALLNNIAEIRLDAFKMVTQSRRPLAERVEDIGAWYGILRILTYIAVVSNAFVIAYTSDYIPRMVYKYVYSNDTTLVGYIDYSLSEFNTSGFKLEWGRVKKERDPTLCQYRGYRNGPNDPNDPYGLSPHYWHVFAARLAFVVVFEHVVFVVTGIMQFIIPDIPVEVKTQIQREQLLAKEAKYQNGLKKSQENDYNELLQALRDQNNSSRQGVRGNWARRLSRISDGLDAHVEIASKPNRRSIESTVWEVT